MKAMVSASMLVELILVVTSAAWAGTVCWTPAHDWAPQGMSSRICAGDLDCDGDADLVLLPLGPVHTYWNTGGTPPVWQLDLTQFDELDTCVLRTGGLGDLDADGDPDLAVICYYDDHVRFFWNTGSCATPVWVSDPTIFEGVPTSTGGGQPRLADMDADGDLDLVYVAATGRIRYAQNVGTSISPSFEYVGQIEEIPYGIGSNATMALGDLDGDGDLDLVRVAHGAQPECFENVGTAQSFVFAENPQMIVGPEVPPDGYGKGIELADMDADGDPDLFLATGYGQNLFYLNDGVVPVEPMSWGRVKALYR